MSSQPTRFPGRRRTRKAPSQRDRGRRRPGRRRRRYCTWATEMGLVVERRPPPRPPRTEPTRRRGRPLLRAGLAQASVTGMTCAPTARMTRGSCHPRRAWRGRPSSHSPSLARSTRAASAAMPTSTSPEPSPPRRRVALLKATTQPTKSTAAGHQETQPDPPDRHGQQDQPEHGGQRGRLGDQRPQHVLLPGVVDPGGVGERQVLGQAQLEEIRDQQAGQPCAEDGQDQAGIGEPPGPATGQVGEREGGRDQQQVAEMQDHGGKLRLRRVRGHASATWPRWPSWPSDGVIRNPAKMRTPAPAIDRPAAIRGSRALPR